jgi:hypothetical protein
MRVAARVRSDDGSRTIFTLFVPPQAVSSQHVPPVIAYVTRFEQQEGDRFASVDVEVPEDVSHVQLDRKCLVVRLMQCLTELPRMQSWLTSPCMVQGTQLQVGDEMRVM